MAVVMMMTGLIIVMSTAMNMMKMQAKTAIFLSQIGFPGSAPSPPVQVRQPLLARLSFRFQPKDVALLQKPQEKVSWSIFRVFALELFVFIA
jgi:hypothetical protein